MDDTDSFIKSKYEDLTLDLNLDKATADLAWSNYECIRSTHILEGEQLPWLACALYAACRRRCIPTVGNHHDVMSQGNYVSLTRMLQYCNLPLTEFILKMKLWLAMSDCEEGFCRRVELLERNFAVSNNIYKKYKPIFLDIFKDPLEDAARPPRSRKQKRPLCNATELFHFCWTLYTFSKGRYPSLPQDLVSSYLLLLAVIDLMYTNVILSNRIDLLNSNCPGLKRECLENKNGTNSLSWKDSIVDYLCNEFDGIKVDTKVIQGYYCEPVIKDLIEKGLLRGTSKGTELLEQSNFDHNVKEIKNAYEEHLLSVGEFDERMFLNEESHMTKLCANSNSPLLENQSNASILSMSHAHAELSLKQSPNYVPKFLARCNLSQTFAGDHHLIPHTPITSRRYTINRPKFGNTPITVITSGLQKLYSLIAGRMPKASDELLTIFRTLPNNPEESISNLVDEMSEKFFKCYSQETEEYSAPNPEFTKMRLRMGQILFYTFLEHILVDEQKRNVDLESILKQELFHRTLFTSSLEIVLKSYNDARRFPWSLQIGPVHPYYFIRIIEPVIRSEKQSEAQLSRELVKHLKGIEEQILDSLAWRSGSPLWEILKCGNNSVPSCEDVNFSHQLESSSENLALNSSSLMSPVVHLPFDPLKSPVTSFLDRAPGTPIGATSARKMLFPTSNSKPSVQSDILKRMQPSSLNGQPICIELPSTLSNHQPVLPSSPNLTRTPQYTINKSSFSTHLSTSKSLSDLGATTSASTNSEGVTSARKDKPRKHGSLALFFRKFYTMANMRLRDMCDRLVITVGDLRQKIWTCFEHSIIHHTELLKDRHLDQMIMCSIYIICKVTVNERKFKEIMKHYRAQPQASSHVYRSVLISSAAENTNNQEADQTSSFIAPIEERADLIIFYNKIYAEKMKGFSHKFRPATTGDVPQLSPLPVARLTPVSPRRRISMKHPVYINSLSPLQSTPNTSSPRKPIPYVFNRSPAKDLNVINTMIRHQNLGVKRGLPENNSSVAQKIPRTSSLCNLGNFKKRFDGILGERHLTTLPMIDCEQKESITQKCNNGDASYPAGIAPLEQTVVISSGANNIDNLSFNGLIPKHSPTSNGENIDNSNSVSDGLSIISDILRTGTEFENKNYEDLNEGLVRESL